MGTRCITVFKDETREIAVLYRQFDGYPDGHGQELKEFLAPMHLCNGYQEQDKEHGANGMDCLAAQIVAHFKKEIGRFYLYPAGTRDTGEEYVYTVYPKDGVIYLRLEEGSVTFFGAPGTPQAEMKPLYDGPAKDFKVEEEKAEA